VGAALAGDDNGTEGSSKAGFVLQSSSLAPRILIEAANAQAQRSAAGMTHSEGTLSFRPHPSALSEAAPRVRCSLLLEPVSEATRFIM
jgi:hypothetical protein